MAAVGGIVLAAGAGSRFRAAGGGIKVLARSGDRSLLEIALAAIADVPLVDRVVVVGAHADDVLSASDLRGVRAVTNFAWDHGMASSLQTGLAALSDACEVALVVLADAPNLQAEAVRRVADAARPDALVSAAYAGRRGHPVAIGRALWALLPAEGELGGKALGEPALLVECGDLGEPGDADTPELVG
jgi:CTP:molybdopterin cytidylyltransferase MocA